MNRAVFLDRDGVINRAPVRLGKPYPPGSLEELEILPGVVEALEQLQRASFLLIVVTNQPDVARGTQTREVVEAMHAFLHGPWGHGFTLKIRCDFAQIVKITGFDLF
jgi:D-glycero-D-manno-heptose 1,7-bisphosphate phosphatase